MLATTPNWAEEVTAVATAVGALGLVSTIGAVIFAAQQVREARHTRQAGMAADFLRRWDEHDLVETRRLISEFDTPQALSVAFERFIATNSANAYILYRELDYFEQLAALERVGAFSFDLIMLLLGRRLADRWDMWKPSIDVIGNAPYPLFEALAARVRASLDSP
jgi:hypothetical protein